MRRFSHKCLEVISNYLVSSLVIFNLPTVIFLLVILFCCCYYLLLFLMVLLVTNFGFLFRNLSSFCMQLFSVTNCTMPSMALILQLIVYMFLTPIVVIIILSLIVFYLEKKGLFLFDF